MRSTSEKPSQSQRMRLNNPMKRPEIVAKVQATRDARGYREKMRQLLGQRHAVGQMRRLSPITAEERTALSARMRMNNPMHRPEIAAKPQTPERRAASSLRMKESWRLGKITTRRHGRAPNKSEARLATVLGPIGFRYVGDGTHWIARTPSGIRRNPDFIHRSARRRVAFLLHGAYYHRDPGLLRAEIDDYRATGWRVLIFWATNHVAQWHLPIILQTVLTWLGGSESPLSAQGQIQQFTISSVTRTITSWPLES